MSVTNLGDFTTSETIYVPFATFNSGGGSVTITGLAVTDIEIYKDGSVTQRSSDAGYALLDTDGIDFDSNTGIHGFSIDLSDNTDAGFYANGSQYWLVVSSITVDSQTVNFVYYFTIGRRKAVADTALTDIHLDRFFFTDYDPGSKPGVATAWANELVENDGGVSRFTANALEQAPSSTGLSSLSTGTAQAGAAGTITLAAGDLATNDIYNGTRVVTTGGTGSGQSRMVTDYVGSTKVATISPNWTTTPDNTTTYEMQAANSDVVLVAGAVASAASGTIDANVIQISGDTTAADNCELFFDGTGYAGGTTKLGVDIVSISSDTTAADNCELFFDGTGYAGGTTKLGVDVVSISGDTTAADNAELMFDGTGYAGGTIKLQVDAVAISGDTTAADNCELFFDGTGYNAANSTVGTVTTITEWVIRTATAQAGATNTITLDASASSTDDFYNGSLIYIKSGTGAGQTRLITDYNGTTKVATVQGSWITDPDNTSVFNVTPHGRVDVQFIEGVDADSTIGTQVNNSLLNIGLDHLVSVAVTGTDVADNSVFAKLVSSSGTADWDDFVNTTDSLQSIRDKQTDIETDTQDLQTQIGTDGVGLTNLGGMSTSMKAEINAEVVDVINTDTSGEPAQGAPPATTSLRSKLDYLYKSWRNKKDGDGSNNQIYADDGTTVDHKQSTSESGGTVTKGEWVTGP